MGSGQKWRIDGHVEKHNDIRTLHLKINDLNACRNNKILIFNVQSTSVFLSVDFVLLQEQVLENRLATWIRTTLSRIVSTG